MLRSNEGTSYGGWLWGEELEILNEVVNGYRVLAGKFEDRLIRFEYSKRSHRYRTAEPLPVEKSVFLIQREVRPYAEGTICRETRHVNGRADADAFPGAQERGREGSTGAARIARIANMPGKAKALSGAAGEFLFLLCGRFVMPNGGNMRNRRVSSQLLAVSCASGDDVLSLDGSANDDPRPSVANDRLYVVGEPVSVKVLRSRPPENRVEEEAFAWRKSAIPSSMSISGLQNGLGRAGDSALLADLFHGDQSRLRPPRDMRSGL